MIITSFTKEDYENLVASNDIKEIDSERQDLIGALYSFDEKIIIKDLSFDEKCDFIKAVIQCEYANNICAVTNLYAIMFASNLSEESFNEEDSWISSLIEYLDLKRVLKPEIEYVYTRMGEYIIGVLKGYSRVLEDNRVHATNLYFNFLNLLNFKTISTILRKADIKKSVSEIPMVMRAGIIFNNINSQQVTSLLFKEIFGKKEG